MSNSSITTGFFEHAAAEILETYGHRVKIGRKSLHKFGRNEDAGTSETEIVAFGSTPVRSTTNSIDTVSSSNATDTQTLRVEGCTIVGNVLTEVIQNVTLTGQTKKLLGTPLSRVTRIANVSNATATLGDVYAYEDTTISAGVPTDPATIGNKMTIEAQSTLLAGTSVGSTNYLILCNAYSYLGKKQSAVANINLETNLVGFVPRTILQAGIGTYRNMDHDFFPFYIVRPNSDILITSLSDTLAVDITAGFSGFYADIIN